MKYIAAASGALVRRHRQGKRRAQGTFWSWLGGLLTRAKRRRPLSSAVPEKSLRTTYAHLSELEEWRSKEPTRPILFWELLLYKGGGLRPSSPTGWGPPTMITALIIPSSLRRVYSRVGPRLPCPVTSGVYYSRSFISGFLFVGLFHSVL